MNIARALSVSEEKGDVSCTASHPRSDDGIVVLGKREACESGPEKSRHFRHDPVGPPTFGFDFIMAARLGREPIGIGGGVPE